MGVKKSEQLEQVLSRYKDKKILVALRGHPDPDSISSALAHQFIAKQHNIETAIMHLYDISHQSNKALMKLLGIEFVKYNDKVNLSDFSGYCLVDSQHPDPEIAQPLREIPLISVVDHHDKENGEKAEFTDIDKEVGAAATIYANYLKELGLLENEKEKETRTTLATALMYGIRSDTDDLLNARKKDLIINSYLVEFADLTKLQKISMQSISPAAMEIIFRAYQNKRIIDNYLISGVGLIQLGERDAIPQAADYLIKRTGIDTVLVHGIPGGNHIDCSFRTLNESIRPSDFIKETFPDVQEGQYGGRYDKGGFKLPLGGILSALSDSKDKNLLTEAVNRFMEKKFYAKLGISEEEEKKEKPD